ncbi:translation initiation factor IF-2 [Lachnospiraceae bacterium XBB2008]|nr:translation initiation factor IF-2 [Lachnospiraceae bacterium XBB2008]
MRVHELAKQLGIESKAVIGWLNENGVEGKTASSSIDEDTAQKAKAALGGGAAPAESSTKAEKKAEAPAKAPAATSGSEEKKPSSEEKKPEAEKKPEGSHEASPHAEKRPAPKDGEAPKKKKSKIIIVSNANNSRMGGQGGRPGAGNRPGGPRPQGRDDGHHTLIRSSVRPSQVNDEPYEVRQRQMQERKEAERRASKANAGEVTTPSETVHKKPERPTSTVVTATLKEGTKPEAPRPRADRNDRGGDRSGKPNAGTDNRFKPGTAPGAGPAPAGSGKDGGRKGKGVGKDQRSKKDHIYEDDDFGKSGKGSKQFVKPEKKEETVEEQIKVITLPETMTLKELADKMKMQPSVIIKKLFLQGQVLTVNSEISYEEAENIAIEFDIICEKEVKVDVIEELLKEEEDAAEDCVARPPVICVMGHVDHGKTSLLDAIRKTNVTDKEAGGITQAIGAYTVNINDRSITFLDTPGHEAFTAMRMRGANSTDIAVLVVAADDGVMPQTIEAINHAKAAGIEIIVAINKIDKPNANIDRVKQELTEYELIPADWGGSTEFVNVSAKSGEGIEDLLETILLTADILELKANPNRKARGLVIEAELDKGRGPVATVLVQKGTLHVGDFISAGACHGKVRAMVDDKGRRLKSAGPSTPVEILGLSDVPSAGEVFIAHENDKTARNFAETYQAQHKEEMLAETKSRMSLDDLFNKIQEGNLKELNVIIKADVQGSVEALKTSLMKLSNDEVVVKCIHGGVGAINESDVILASASDAIIIGFNVRADAQTKDTADREGVDIRLYKVIYQAIEDIEAAMKGLLAPVYEEKIIGHAEIRQIFKASALGNIAGSYVLDGEITRGCKVRITREGEQIFEGNLASLKRFKDDVKEVKSGFECGLVFEDFDAIAELDQVEAYIMVEVPR